MISNFSQITEFMDEVDKLLEIPVHLYLIGGGMMLFQKLKTATKDIDLIVETRREFGEVESVLRKSGFRSGMPVVRWQGKADLSQILIRGELRIDLFQKKVCGGFSLTESMKKRGTEVLRLKKVTLSACSLEDVFILKTFTERPGDIDDCVALAKKSLNWKVVLREIRLQVRRSGNPVWITWIGERLDLLKEREVLIPIMNQVDKLRLAYFDDYEKRHP